MCSRLRVTLGRYLGRRRGSATADSWSVGFGLRRHARSSRRPEYCLSWIRCRPRPWAASRRARFAGWRPRRAVPGWHRRTTFQHSTRLAGVNASVRESVQKTLTANRPACLNMAPGSPASRPVASLWPWRAPSAVWTRSPRGAVAALIAGLMIRPSRNAKTTRSGGTVNAQGPRGTRGRSVSIARDEH